MIASSRVWARRRRDAWWKGSVCAFQRRSQAAPVLSLSYESSVPGIYVLGMLGGAPLIKQALNQGYEAIEHILGRRIEPADEPLLKAKFASLKGIGSVAQTLALLQKNMPLLGELSTLQLRELMLDSEVHRPKPDQVIFRKGSYSNSFYSVIHGECWVKLKTADGGNTRVALRKGDFSASSVCSRAAAAPRRSARATTACWWKRHGTPCSS